MLYSRTIIQLLYAQFISQSHLKLAIKLHFE